jgi:hypothetical protein
VETFSLTPSLPMNLSSPLLPKERRGKGEWWSGSREQIASLGGSWNLSPRRRSGNVRRGFVHGFTHIASLPYYRAGNTRRERWDRFQSDRTAILPRPGEAGRGEGGPQSNISAFLLGLFAIIPLAASVAAPLPAEWQHTQQFEVAAPGLVTLSLPVATLDAARPALEDLRLYDDAGKELPYLIQHPSPATRTSQSAKSFQVSLNPSKTVITLETGLARPLDGVTLESPATSFIKSVQIETSADGKQWETIAQGQPIFRQPNGASQLHLALPPGPRPWLRLTVDDQRSQPIPFTGGRVHAARDETAPGESLPATIAERHENPGETRFTLDLGAANLDLANIHIETSEPLFTRPVTLAVPQVMEDSIREQAVARSTIYRVAIEGQTAVSNLTVPLDRQVRSRELLLLIQNQDSPPLPITAVRVERRPVYLIFLARSAGVYHLLTGNRRCAAPRYDLAALGDNLKDTAVTPIQLSSLTDNPGYRAPELLPGVPQDGTALDVAAWKFRKAVKLTRAGAQQLELDLEVLARAQPDFRDLRLLRDGQQLPYIIERTSISRRLLPVVTATNDAKILKLSRWIVKLPQGNLPLTCLSCATRTALFERELTLYEEVADERGEKYRRNLGAVTWVQTPNRPVKEFAMTFGSPLQTDTLILETHNGDNPPIELENFEVFYSATRVLFKAEPESKIFLYYGNPRVPPPHYDLSLVAGQLLAADKTSAALAAGEQLKKSPWAEGRTAGKGGVLFWGILALVVVALLVIISRLLPKSSQSGEQSR